MFNVNIYERYFGQLEKVWGNMKGKRTKECIIFKKKKKKNSYYIRQRLLEIVVFIFGTLYVHVYVCILGLIELELSSRLWFWLNNERRNMFQYLESSIYVLL